MQNLISVSLSDEDLAQFDQALTTLRRLMAPMVALRTDQRRKLKKMGPKSVAFCEETLTVLSNNPGLVPPDLGLAEAQKDQRTLSQLRSRFVLLHQLSEKAKDTEMALGSDLMRFSLEGYNLLRTVGKHESLKDASRSLGRRFAKRAGVREEEEEVPAS